MTAKRKEEAVQRTASDAQALGICSTCKDVDACTTMKLVVSCIAVQLVGTRGSGEQVVSTATVQNDRVTEQGCIQPIVSRTARQLGPLESTQRGLTVA